MHCGSKHKPKNLHEYSVGIEGADLLFLSSLYQKLGTFLGDHYGWCIGIAGGDAGHDRGVNDSQVIYAMDLEAIVDHGHGVVAHLAGSRRMMLCVCIP